VVARAQRPGDVERLEGDEPLIVRREFVYLRAAVGRADGIDELRLERREVVVREEPAARLDLGDYLSSAISPS